MNENTVALSSVSPLLELFFGKFDEKKFKKLPNKQSQK